MPTKAPRSRVTRVTAGTLAVTALALAVSLTALAGDPLPSPPPPSSAASSYPAPAESPGSSPSLPADSTSGGSAGPSGSAAAPSLTQGSAAPDSAQPVTASTGPRWQKLPVAMSNARKAGTPVLLLFSSAPSPTDELPAELARRSGEVGFARFDPPSEGVNNVTPAQFDTVIWAERFAVDSVPQAILLDSEGRPTVRLKLAEGTLPGDADVTRALTALSSRDKLLKAAASTSGEDRVRTLDLVLEKVSDFRSFYPDLLEQVVELDPAGTLGLRAKYYPELAGLRIDAAVQQEVYPLIDAGHFDEAAARLDAVIGKWGPKSGKLDLLYAFKGQVLSSAHRKNEALAALTKALEFAERGSEMEQQIRRAIEKANEPEQPPTP